MAMLDKDYEIVSQIKSDFNFFFVYLVIQYYGLWDFNRFSSNAD